VSDKVCILCKELLSFSAFGIAKNNRDKRTYRCKSCITSLRHKKKSVPRVEGIKFGRLSEKENIALLRAHESRKRKDAINNLHDEYVIRLICARTSLTSREVTTEMIARKREQLRVDREMKRLLTTIKEKSK